MTETNWWKFKENVELNSDCDFWYDISLGAYIKAEELLEDKDQIDKLNKALEIVESFERAYMIRAEELEENEDD